MHSGSLLVVAIVLLCTACVTCIEVPKEWRDAVRALCEVAQNGVLPHPSPHAQMLYATVGSSTSSLEVYKFNANLKALHDALQSHYRRHCTTAFDVVTKLQ